MSEPPILYAKVGGPPDDWFRLKIINLANGREVTHVKEVDAAAGWLVRHRLNKHGQPFERNGRIATERLRGRFEIRRAAP